MHRHGHAYQCPSLVSFLRNQEIWIFATISIIIIYHTYIHDDSACMYIYILYTCEYIIHLHGFVTVTTHCMISIVIMTVYLDFRKKQA